MKTFLSVLALVLCGLVVAQGQASPSPKSDDYVRKGSIGSVTTPLPTTTSPLSDLPIEKWLNQRFVFTPRTRQFQRFGYDGFLALKGDKRKSSKYESPIGSSIPYEKYVGRIATVSAVNTVRPYGSYSDLTRLQIEFTMDDTGERLVYEPSYGSKVDGITPVAVLDFARAKYLGKTMWIVDSLLSTFDEANDADGYVRVRRYSPVTVREIVLSNRSDGAAPVRFVLQSEDGKQGFVDVALSAMNADPLSLINYPLEQALLTVNPRLEYSWSDEIWSLIEQGKVRLGMTEKQVLMSVGRPERINRTQMSTGVREQWVYGTRGNYRYFYFTNGLLSAAQD